jgi:hypothetical protein
MLFIIVAADHERDIPPPFSGKGPTLLLFLIVFPIMRGAASDEQ